MGCLLSFYSEVNMDDRLRVGVITKTHGIKGEVKVYPTTDDVNRFKKLKKVYLTNQKESIETEIESVKFFKELVILKFKCIKDCDEALKYVKYDILIDRSDAIPLKENENYICDLIGLKAINEEGVEIGELIDVMLTGANDVYVIKALDGHEILLPAIKQCILDVDLESKIIKVHVMKGLE